MPIVHILIFFENNTVIGTNITLFRFVRSFSMIARKNIFAIENASLFSRHVRLDTKGRGFDGEIDIRRGTL